MSVQVVNGISEIRSTAGHVLKFKGSENDPVLIGAGLEDCRDIGNRFPYTTRAQTLRRVRTFVLDADEQDQSSYWMSGPALEPELNVTITHISVTTVLPAISIDGAQIQKVVLQTGNTDPIHSFDTGGLYDVFSGTQPPQSNAAQELASPVTLNSGDFVQLRFTNELDVATYLVQGKLAVTVWYEKKIAPTMLTREDAEISAYLKVVDAPGGDPVEGVDLVVFRRAPNGTFAQIPGVYSSDAEGLVSIYATPLGSGGVFISPERYVIVQDGHIPEEEGGNDMAFEANIGDEETPVEFVELGA